MTLPRISLITVLMCAIACASNLSGAVPPTIAAGHDDLRIKPFKMNPRYWQHKGRPVILLGGSQDDNLFQIPNLREHLDEIKAAGGNYIRNTMSARPDFGFEVQEFRKLPDGRYDLNQWNNEYWTRFENLLRWCHERDIIIQIELWDRFDYSQTRWVTNPWNPVNNVNYTYEQTGFAAEYPASADHNMHPFFFSIPGMSLYTPKLDTVRMHQERRVAQILSYSLKYPNVLYCINNETSGPPQWGWYWADYLRKQASAVGRGIEVTDMFWSPDLKAEVHRASLDDPARYSFFEASQNSAKLDPEENWRNLQFVYERLRFRSRPINNTKIYGADGGPSWAGSTRNAQEKFWRSVMGGSAASRFHRPPTGLGLSDAARVHIKSLRMLTDAMDVFSCMPANDLLGDRRPNEAFCLAEPGRQYAVFFPDGGAVKLDLAAAVGMLQLRWLDVAGGAWREPQTQIITGGRTLELNAPGHGHWAVLILVQTGAKQTATAALEKNPR